MTSVTVKVEDERPSSKGRTTIIRRSYDDHTMSLIPSSSAVNKMLERMRAEKAAMKATFLAAVEVAKVEWEAELLLALEEFRDAGGFSNFHKSVTTLFETLNKPYLPGMSRGPKKYFKDLLDQYYQNMKVQYAFKQREGACSILSLFLADKMDIKAMLYYGFEDMVFHGHEGPTMASERAALRHAMLKVVRNEVLAPIQEEMRVEEERRSALNQEYEKYERNYGGLKG